MAAIDWSGIATVIGSGATFVSACGLAVSHFRGDNRHRYDDDDEENMLSDLEHQVDVLRERVEERKRQAARRKHRRSDFTAWIRRLVTA